MQVYLFTRYKDKLSMTKPVYVLCFLSLFIMFRATGQEKQKQAPLVQDSLAIKNLNEVVISALRLNIPLRQIQAAISVVTNDKLNALSRPFRRMMRSGSFPACGSTMVQADPGSMFIFVAREFLPRADSVGSGFTSTAYPTTHPAVSVPTCTM